ncbi:AMP-binding protein [Enhygromyxa salina]|uniref:Putative sulfoacetate--CoA ligase n=1 Tax=Enhygromyxa salina TaxID=215803 RepID=A0A2S9YRE2_9BACT|nr:AMP-binding protein [Enhygromyxa salina]PRQ07650.1 putative sulfoacetate--CoA ligase [Enhygromyxa salina]
MTDRYPAVGLASRSLTVAGLAPIVAPSLAHSPALSPILAHHDPESLVAFGLVAGSDAQTGAERTAERLRTDVARVVAVLPECAPDDPREILCVATDRYHFTVALLAAWQRGHRVALPPNAQPELLRAVADDRTISLVIHDTDEMSGLDLRPLLAEESRATPAEPLALAPLPALRKLVTVWTSGSTGEHQRHAKTAGQLFAEALTLAEHFGLAVGSGGGRARVVATVPSHHIYGLLFSVLVPLVSGGAFSRETPLHAVVVRATLLETDANVLVSVPAHLRALRILDPGQLPALARVFSSGAPLPPETASMLRERFDLSVTEVLGSTETGGIAWRVSGPADSEAERVAGADNWAPVPHWTALPHVRVSAVEGRLLVDSPFLPPDGPRPWPTADRIEFIADPSPAGVRRLFRHLGRVDGVVKIGAKRVAIAEIERRLLEIDGVEDVAVAVIEVGGARGHEPVALVVAPGLSPEHLRTELRRWLDPVVIPRRLRLVDALPREPNGKLTRRAIVAEIEQPKPRVLSLECRSVRNVGRGAGAGPDSPNFAEYEVYVPRDLYSLRGHFRGAPIVPGVVQLELARAEALARWPDLGALRWVRRLKFVRPLAPGERLRLILDRCAADRVEFSFVCDGDRVSVGSLSFATTLAPQD